jgi:mRNA interferase RelE/StbE
MYEVILERRARKYLEKLSGDILKRIDKVLTQLEINPRPSGVEKLTGYNLWRIRIGNHRIIYEIDDKSKKVIIYKIKPRKEAYRRV